MNTTNEMSTTPRWQIPDNLWDQLEPRLRIDKPRKKSGRPRRDDRILFQGLLWLCLSGEQWAALPSEFGPKSTCHARFREWIDQGALAAVWPLIVVDFPELAAIDWQRTDDLLKSPAGRKGPSVLRRAPVRAAGTTEPAEPGTGE